MHVYIVGHDMPDSPDGCAYFSNKHEAIKCAKDNPGNEVRRVEVAKMPHKQLILACLNGAGWAESFGEIIFEAVEKTVNLDDDDRRLDMVLSWKHEDQDINNGDDADEPE